MKVLKNKRKDNTVSLEIRMDTDNMPSALDRAYSRVKKDVKVQGFRQGKVPRSVFEKNYGPEYLIQDAVSFLVDDAYRAAIEELDLKIVDYPKDVDIDEYKEGKEITFRCNVDVQPEIKLGKYKGLKLKREPEEATAEQLEEELARMTDQYAEYKESDKTTEDQDIVQMNMVAKIDGEEYAPWTRQNAGSRIGMANYGPDFDTEVTGLKKDDKKSFTVTLPDTFNNDDLKGKTVDFEVEVISVRGKVAPELTDEFVKEKLTDYSSVEDLKTKVKGQLDERAKQESEQKLKTEAVKMAVDDVKVDIPEGMVNSECDRQLRMFEQTLMQSGIAMKQYMEMTKKTVDDMRNDVREQAEGSVKTQMVLEAVRKKEGIEATDDELQAEIDEWKNDEVKTLEDLKNHKHYDAEALRDSLSERKTVDFIVENAKIK